MVRPLLRGLYYGSGACIRAYVGRRVTAFAIDVLRIRSVTNYERSFRK